MISVCQSIRPEPPQPQTARQSVVIDGTGPRSTTDPVQAQTEAEFLAAAIAKEEAYYAKDFETLRSFYADTVVSVQPGLPEIDGQVAWAEGMAPFLAANDTIDKLTIKHIWVSGDYAMRQAEWDEIITPNDGGKPFHQIGRCVLNWQKIDGEWKVISEFINDLVPPTKME